VNALNIFLVEDHRDTRDGLARLLRQSGHQVSTAGSIAEALRDLPGSGCEVLISDLGLPDGDGCELLRLARLPPRIHTIAITGFGMPADRRRTRDAGFRHHLVKPVDPDTLERLLGKLDAGRGA
jgi:CheY-like chemotaxis protein